MTIIGSRHCCVTALSTAVAALLLSACPGAPATTLTISPSTKITNAASAGDGYKAWLDTARTASRAVAITRTTSGDFREVDLFDTQAAKASPGDKLLFVNHDRTAILVVVGQRPIADSGLRIIAAHLDTPSPRLRISGLTRANQTAIKLERYGGMRRHHWAGRPVAVVGRVAPRKGPELEISLGLEGEDDFAFFVTRKGTAMTLVTSTTPTKSAATPSGSGYVARTLVDLLHQRYGLVASDLEASELYVVPRSRAREVGIDGDLIGGHGHDDRVNSYAAWRAIVDLDLEAPSDAKAKAEAAGKAGARTVPEATAMVWLVDREEVGSTGRFGAQSRFFELVVAWLLRGQGALVTEAAMHRTLGASLALSADTPAAINPNFPEVHEAKNAPVIGRGPALFPFTGRGGKEGGSAARAELIASVVRSFALTGAALQHGELGRVDEGGGGTVAQYLARRGIDVVDVGVPVISMHSPFELVSRQDIWAAYRGFRAWLWNAPAPAKTE